MKNVIYLGIIFLFIACSKDEQIDDKVYVVWDGPTTVFTKQANTDPSNASNYDKITESVALTRGNNGGEIYNILSESAATKGVSPAGTEWAVGELSDVSSLSFRSFRNAVGSPKQVVGKALVVHIKAEDVYVSVKFKSWGSGQNGAFSYERSTQD